MKSAFVTGGGRGLGKGFVACLLDQGYTVFSGERNPITDRKQHPNLHLVTLDVSSDQSISEAIKTIAAKTDHLDYLINNAALNKDSVTQGHPEKVSQLENLNRQMLLRMFDINTVAPLLVLQQCLMLLQRSPSSFVINISSARGSYHDENPNSSANYGYRSSKSALNMMTFSSLFDLPETIKTFAVHPGSVNTDMNPKGLQKPYDQASSILSITSSSYWKEEFNGRFLRYDGDLYPL